MDVYLLEKMSRTTYAILADGKIDAKATFMGTLNPLSAVGMEGYKPRKFIEGQDGDIINTLSDDVKITYYRNPNKTYFIHQRYPIKLI